MRAEVLQELLGSCERVVQVRPSPFCTILFRLRCLRALYFITVLLAGFLPTAQILSTPPP